MIRRIHEFDGVAEEASLDPELQASLAVLDPASGDPNYWLRFRWWVMSGAAAELARRRQAARLTVADVVESWARALLPTAALVAAVAGMLLLRADQSTTDFPPIVGEELLLSEVEGNAVPIDVSAMSFAAEIF
jgi:hypothetical protein